jgi:uncharacterized membrane protein YczE
MKKVNISAELVYALAIILISFSVAMISCTGFGVSMVVAPAYILSLRFPRLFTFGLAEYAVQGVLMVAFCIVMRKVKPVYLTAFITCLIYGAVLDLWRLIIPLFNPSVTEPGTLNIALSLTLFVVGNLITALSIAMFFRTYLYPQVYDFFVKGVSQRYKISTDKFKVLYDFSSLIVSVVMTLVLFGRIEGIGIGTLAVTLVNGALIAFWGRIIDKFFVITPTFKGLSKFFSIN